jgi:predicted unusual protein kinase regulating ubiquinone biosynthesis (AarF/ABC1/UbiB family)
VPARLHAVGESTAETVPAAVFSHPRSFPRKLPTPTRRQLAARTWQISRVVARYFGIAALRGADEMRRSRRVDVGLAIAKPLRRTFEELGATFMKFGQLIASAPGVFGEEVASEFRSCLDTGPVVSPDEVRDIVEADLGMALDDAFSHFELYPIGRASIAVVHRAVTSDGREVAVKILRPGIEGRVAVDLDLMQPLLEVVARYTGEDIAGGMLQLLEGFREQMAEELDLRNELRAMLNYRSLLGQVDLPLIVVPEPLQDLSGPRVLTMEYLKGRPIDDLSAIQEMGLDPTPIIDQMVKAFFMTALRWGFFHGDVHAGNLLVLPDGRVGVLDWGIVGRLDADTHLFFRKIIEASLGEESAWAEVTDFFVRIYGSAVSDALGVEGDELVAMVRTLMEPILTKPFGEISLAELIQGPRRQAEKARGIEARKMTVRGIWRRFAEQRRIRAKALEHGGLNSDFDRQAFLLSKQLMYFERYGKMFLSDTSILSDVDFFRAVLAAS